MTETIRQLSARVGRTRGTVTRWITEGVQVGTRVVKLAAVRVGGRWTIPAGAWERFGAECNPGVGPALESPASATRRAAAAKQQALKLIGGAS